MIVTSLHAADALATMAGRDGLVYAVGPRHRRRGRRAGFPKHPRRQKATRCRCRPSSGANSARAASLLHVTGHHHKEEPARSLREAGYSVTLWEAYVAEAVEALPEGVEAALRHGRIDAALHYSRRSANLFLTLARRGRPDAGTRRLSTFLSFGGRCRTVADAGFEGPCGGLAGGTRSARSARSVRRLSLLWQSGIKTGTKPCAQACPSLTQECPVTDPSNPQIPKIQRKKPRGEPATINLSSKVVAEVVEPSASAVELAREAVAIEMASAGGQRRSRGPGPGSGSGGHGFVRRVRWQFRRWQGTR